MGLYKRKELRATFASSLAVIAMLLASPLLASPVQAEIISYEGQHSDDRLGLHSSGASNWSVDEDSMSLCGMGDTDSYPTTKSRSEPPQRSQNVKQNIHKAKVRGYGLPSHVLYAGVLATAFVGVKNGMGWWDGMGGVVGVGRGKGREGEYHEVHFLDMKTGMCVACDDETAFRIVCYEC